jgi:osomolarity two-component system, sensor histidine kinase SLN1
MMHSLKLTASGSNACKFTPHGGSLTIKTKLVHPLRPTRSNSSDLPIPELRTGTETVGTPTTMTGTNILCLSYASLLTAISDTGKSEYAEPMLSAARLDQHNSIHNKAHPIELIVVRIEVSDSGCGIRRRDMVQSKLFCKS